MQATESHVLNEKRLTWALLGLGMAALYLPTFYELSTTLWASDQQGQGPIVLALSAWLIWRARDTLDSQQLGEPRPVLGWTLVVVSLILYVLGRSQGIWLFEMGSMIPLLSGCILLVRGARQLRTIWFALFFMLFMIPLPGTLVAALTQPMKQAVSWAVENLLFALGYPISRTGVELQVGPYELLVADACAGLNTLFTLEAIGLLYMNVVRSSSALRNIVLATLIIPISFSANVIRVCILCLITYYFGDEAGQGFLHGFAGIVLFLSALGLIIAADTMLRFAAHDRPATRPTAS